MARTHDRSDDAVPTSVAGISAQALIGLRNDMLRFAQLQLRNAEVADGRAALSAPDDNAAG